MVETLVQTSFSDPTNSKAGSGPGETLGTCEDR